MEHGELVMADVLFFKLVAAMPQQPEPNAFYAVRVGNGFDFYLTDSEGNVPVSLNMTKIVKFTDEAAYNAYTPADNVIAILVGA